jgi:hypothetical protein
MLESGVIFSDPFAAKILDRETRARLDETAADASLRPIVCSSPRAAGFPRIRWRPAWHAARARSWC